MGSSYAYRKYENYRKRGKMRLSRSMPLQEAMATGTKVMKWKTGCLSAPTAFQFSTTTGVSHWGGGRYSSRVALGDIKFTWTLESGDGGDRSGLISRSRGNGRRQGSYWKELLEGHRVGTTGEMMTHDAK